MIRFIFIILFISSLNAQIRLEREIKFVPDQDSLLRDLAIQLTSYDSGDIISIPVFQDTLYFYIWTMADTALEISEDNADRISYMEVTEFINLVSDRLHLDFIQFIYQSNICLFRLQSTMVREAKY